MSAPWRGSTAVVACFFAGIVLHMWLATDPENLVDARGQKVDWVLPGATGANTRAADAVWRTRWPWGKPPEPVPVVVVPPPPPPPAVPVGIIAVGKGYEALFLDPMLGEVRLSTGGQLSNGSRVTKVTANRVDWVSSDGAKHHHELLSDPAIPLPVLQPQVQLGLSPVLSPE